MLAKFIHAHKDIYDSKICVSHVQKYIQLQTCIQNYASQKAIGSILEYIVVIIHYAK